MDDHRFDALTRSLSSRRTALGGVLGSIAGLLGLALPEEADAHNYLARCRRIQDPPRRRACIRRARAHNRSHQCVPSCAGKACGSDGCTGSCGTCPRGTCSAGQCVCPAGQFGCAATLCCPNGQACPGGQTCGACPANSPALCSGVAHSPCGISSEGDGCGCVKSVQGAVACSAAYGGCVACTTDAQCTTALGEPGICVDVAGCPACPETSGRACIVATCR